MDAEDTVVDLEGVTAPEKPAPAHEAPNAAASTTTAPTEGQSAEDEPSLTDEANPWQKPSTGDANGDHQGEAQEEERPAKKPRTEIMRDTSSKRRGARMFGVLQGTLSNFQKERSKTDKSDAARRRQDIEDRLRQKLRAEQEVSERKNERTKMERHLRTELHKRQDEKAMLEQIHKKRQANVLHLANFLLTSTSSSDPSASSSTSTTGLASRPTPLSQRLPQHAHPAALPTPPVYFRPYKLLPDQSAQIDDQVSAAKREVEQDREQWTSEAADLDDKIAEAAREKERFDEDRERQEREERLKERRERDDHGDGDAEDEDMGRQHRDRSRSPRRRSPSRASPSVDCEDAAMD